MLKNSLAALLSKYRWLCSNSSNVHGHVATNEKLIKYPNQKVHIEKEQIRSKAMNNTAVNNWNLSKTECALTKEHIVLNSAVPHKNILEE